MEKEIKLIATHSGNFQADEVTGVAILKLIYPEAKIIRTRNEEEYSKADLRLDVGQKYDEKTHDYDHHQKEGAGNRENGIPYAAAGLIWKHFGKKLCSSDQAWTRIEEKIIVPIDAIDNGVTPWIEETARPYTLSALVKCMTPSWQEDGASYDDAFFKAVELIQTILKREIYKTNGMEKANEIVSEAISKSDGKIVVLEQFAPWKKKVCEDTEALFVVYPSLTGAWNVNVVPEKTSSFIARKNLPSKWGGTRADELAQITGVKDAVFCHRALFICAAGSKEGALELAKQAVENQENRI